MQPQRRGNEVDLVIEFKGIDFKFDGTIIFDSCRACTFRCYTGKKVIFYFYIIFLNTKVNTFIAFYKCHGITNSNFAAARNAVKVNFGISKVVICSFCNCKYSSAILPVNIIKVNTVKVFYRFCAAAPAVNGKGIACAGCFIIASIQIGICDIGRTADNDFVVISTTTIIYIAAVNIT